MYVQCTNVSDLLIHTWMNREIGSFADVDISCAHVTHISSSVGYDAIRKKDAAK